VFKIHRRPAAGVTVWGSLVTAAAPEARLGRSVTIPSVMLLPLPETRGRAIASLEAEAPGAAAHPSRPAVGRS
jgi:hypothetical protein